MSQDNKTPPPSWMQAVQYVEEAAVTAGQVRPVTPCCSKERQGGGKNSHRTPNIGAFVVQDLGFTYFIDCLICPPPPPPQSITLLAKHDTYGISFEWDASDQSIERTHEPPVDSKWTTDLNQMNAIYSSLKTMMAKNPLEYKRVG